jgi:hypothetical protein
MSETPHGKILHSLLSDLSGGQAGALLHLLTCEHCRENTAVLLEENLGCGREPAEFASFWNRLAQDLPPLLDEARERFAESQELLADLLARPDLFTAAQDERFHSPFLLELLLEAGQQIQTRSPEQAEQLAGVAALLTGHLHGNDVREEEVALWRARAAALSGNARRLLGRWKQAEEAFRSTAFYLRLTWGPGLETASFCRSFGLLRWEQGRLEEAEALLRQGARTFGEMGLTGEEGATQALLGLLSLERDRPDRAIRLLQGGLLGLDPGARPWLVVRAALSLALALATTGKGDRATTVLEGLRRRRGGLDERELVRADWLEGKVYAGLGLREPAAHRLDGVRLLLLAEGSLPEAVLCSLDLAVLKTEAGREPEWPRLLRDLETAFAAEKGLDSTLRIARAFAAATEGLTPVPRQQVVDAAAALRKMYRLRGDRVEALPFA